MEIANLRGPILKHDENNMLPEDEVRVDSYRLVAGGSFLQLTHIPTGSSVSSPPSDEPYLRRLAKLHEQLEILVNKPEISRAIPLP